VKEGNMRDYEEGAVAITIGEYRNLLKNVEHFNILMKFLYEEAVKAEQDSYLLIDRKVIENCTGLKLPHKVEPREEDE
jgi:hypothetical protein